MLLTIAIPTFNRAGLLQEQLEKLLPWVEPYKNEAEILVLDNASTDGTKGLMESLSQTCCFLRYIRNQENLGFDGNTIKCIENAQGDYVALLSDDDRYIEETVSTLLHLVRQSQYSLICLNYYGFKLNELTPTVYYAEPRDMRFSPGTEIFMHPSVGHLSAFVYKTALANQCLPKVRRYIGTRYLYVALGIYVSNIAEAFFLGERVLATRIPDKVEWGFFDVCVTNAVRFYRDAAEEGVFTEAQQQKRERSIIRALPKHLIREIGVNGYEVMKPQLDMVDQLFNSYWVYRVMCKPIVFLGSFRLAQGLYARFYWFVRSLKDKR